MSFLVAEDGDDGAQELLHMALAFVDSWADDDSGDVATSEEVLEELPCIIAASSPTSSKTSSSSYWDDHATTSEDDGGMSSGLDALDEVLEAIGETTIRAAGSREAAASRPHVPLPQPQQPPPPPPPSAPVKRNSKWTKSAAESVKRSRAKKKAEVVELRARLKELEAAFGALQQQKRARIEHEGALQVHLQRKRRKDGGYELQAANGALQAAATTDWQEAAATQARERLQALALNAKLRDAIGHHTKLIEVLQSMMASKQSQFGLDLLRDEQRQALYNDTAIRQESGVLLELRVRVLQMHAQVESVFDHRFWRQFGGEMLSAAHVKLDPDTGPCFELRANAPLQCSAAVAGDLMWTRTLELSSVISTPQYIMTRQLISASSFQKDYSLKLEGPAGVIDLQGMSYFQRFNERGRFAYIWASTIHSAYGETFHEKGWVVAFPDSQDAASRSLFRVFYQISTDADIDDEAEAKDPTLKAQRFFVLKTLSIRTQAFQEFVQNALLDEFSGYQMRKPIEQFPAAISCLKWDRDSALQSA